MLPLLTIVGATGLQGGSVLASALKTKQYRIRAITRNAQSASALKLASQGVELVVADLDDEASLVKAFEVRTSPPNLNPVRKHSGWHNKDSTAIFAMTNFFGYFPQVSAEEAVIIETKQAINLASAAAKTPTLKHYIWSTLPNIAKITKGKYDVPHTIGKNRADDHIKANEELRKKTTFLWCTFYAQNFMYPIFTPTFLVCTALRWNRVSLPRPDRSSLFRSQIDSRHLKNSSALVEDGLQILLIFQSLVRHLYLTVFPRVTDIGSCWGFEVFIVIFGWNRKLRFGRGGDSQRIWADQKQKTIGKYVQLLPVPADTPMDTIGDVGKNLGIFASAIFAQPEKTWGKYVLASVETTTMGKFLQYWSEGTGKESLYVQLASVQEYENIFPMWGTLEGNALKFWEEYPDQSWVNVDGVQVLTKNDLKIDEKEFVGVKETVEGQDWSKLWYQIAELGAGNVTYQK